MTKEFYTELVDYAMTVYYEELKNLRLDEVYVSPPKVTAGVFQDGEEVLFICSGAYDDVERTITDLGVTETIETVTDMMKYMADKAKENSACLQQS